MRIFVSEYIAGGGMSDSALPPSLLREGRAMLAAVVDDLLAIPNYRVAITLDHRVRETLALPASQFLDIVDVDHVSLEQATFERLCSETDATLVIAPETGGELHQRVERVIDLGRPSLNCVCEAIDLCGDKLLLAEHFIDRGIATIQTRMLPAGECPWSVFDRDCVVKPRDGAGSWLTTAIPRGDAVTWKHARTELIAAGVIERAVVQPYIAGQSLSIGCLCDAFGDIAIFPIARQLLTTGNFQYQGGIMPAELSDRVITAVHESVRSACQSIPGLRGYVGIDLLLPDTDPASPLIVEINPRLTTSYVGYRKLCRSNLAERMLQHTIFGKPIEPLAWNSCPVRFDAAGECQYQLTGSVARP